ncbi:hypothetical protein HMI54_006013 [Coelomomyces lativittatus]|nr:hypothetical protein HMI54_006013 [Coelomomyces lativittatus]KAJ1509245.1 hypothetical protein HMI56_006889 [Coelomomyces lativittatus]KAJ1516608.1 hypothetical protein HMI55_001858 [Coelomomyces lativittatus]
MLSLAPSVSKKPLHAKPTLLKSVSVPNFIIPSSSSSSPSLPRSKSLPSTVYSSTCTSNEKEHEKLVGDKDPNASLFSFSSQPYVPASVVLLIGSYLSIHDLSHLRLVHSSYFHPINQLLLHRLSSALHPSTTMATTMVDEHLVQSHRNDLETLQARSPVLLRLVNFRWWRTQVSLVHRPLPVPLRWVCECMVRLVCTSFGNGHHEHEEEEEEKTTSMRRRSWTYAPGRVPWSIVQRELLHLSTPPSPSSSSSVSVLESPPHTWPRGSLSQRTAIAHLLAHPWMTGSYLLRYSVQGYYALLFITTVLEILELQDQVDQLEAQLRREGEKRKHWVLFLESLQQYSSWSGF